jgi:hypothetical protein
MIWEQELNSCLQSGGGFEDEDEALSPSIDLSDMVVVCGIVRKIAV